jgi:hypothetical protein
LPSHQGSITPPLNQYWRERHECGKQEENAVKEDRHKFRKNIVAYDSATASRKRLRSTWSYSVGNSKLLQQYRHLKIDAPTLDLIVLDIIDHAQWYAYLLVRS